MTKFRKVIDGKTSYLTHRLSDKLVKNFFDLSSTYLYQKRDARKPNTNAIKYSLVKLGHKLNYRVYANGLTVEQRKEQDVKYSFVCREFLFDVHWYRDRKGKFYVPQDVSLVVESELGDRRRGDASKLRNPAVKFDFQKLLLANASLRLMVFKTKNLQDLSELDNYFDEAISAYRLLQKGSIFLFVCFVHDEKEMYYTEKRKP